MKLLIVFIFIISTISQEAKHDVNILHRPIQPKLPCPNSADSLNRRNCFCPLIQNGVSSKNYWQTGHVFETGSGGRSDTIRVYFPRAFCRTPHVVASLTGLDNSHDHNLRIVIAVVSQTATYFDVKFSTWADTYIYMVAISYIAYA